MADYMDYKQAATLANDLARQGGKMSAAQHVARMERQCMQASRLIRAMLRQVNPSDNWKLPDEE